MGTLDAVQMLQAQNAQLQKSRDAYGSRSAELERLRREGAPQKELEKVGQPSRPPPPPLRAPMGGAVAPKIRL